MSANSQLLNTLNAIQISSLRLAIGAFKTSPINSILAEMNEIPSEIHRSTLAINYSNKNNNKPWNDMDKTTWDLMTNQQSIP